MADAACKAVDPAIFFPARNEPDSGILAKKICAGCPVRKSCLQWALYYNEREGVWGGESARTRRLLRREMGEDKRTLFCQKCGCEYQGHSRSRLCSEECRKSLRKEARAKYKERISA
jgi:WhiB family redox-sensing transcriptional regulator